jgi:hypothetical protein
MPKVIWKGPFYKRLEIMNATIATKATRYRIFPIRVGASLSMVLRVTLAILFTTKSNTKKPTTAATAKKNKATQIMKDGVLVPVLAQTKPSLALEKHTASRQQRQMPQKLQLRLR